MIDIFEALSWLNQFDGSNLSMPVQSLVEIIDDPRTTEANLKGTCAHAHSMSEVSLNYLERPELLLHCGAAYYQHDYALEAIRLIRDAYDAYEPDEHYRAVTAWMLGTSAAAASDFNLAFQSWDEARCIFSSLAAQKLCDHDPVSRMWYLDRLKEMKRDLVSLPREAYTWLNHFEPSCLSCDVQEIKVKIINSIARRRILQAYDFVRDLKLVCNGHRDHMETSEIMLECGLQFYTLGNIADAADILNRSVSSFPPQSHKQAVARWMLGAVQWLSRDMRHSALASWERSIDNFKNLALKADYEDKQKQKEWYLGLIEVLEPAAQEMIRKNY